MLVFFISQRNIRGSRVGSRGSWHTPLENKKKYIWFLSNTGPDPLKITNLPSQHSMLGHHRPANETPFKWRFHWRADDGPLIMVFESSLPSSTKKTVKIGPPLTKLSGSAHEKAYDEGTLSIAHFTGNFLFTWKFFMLHVVCWFFSKLSFLKNSSRITIRVSNSLDPDQAWGPTLFRVWSGSQLFEKVRWH